MVKLPQMVDLELEGKRVVVRLDLDTGPNPDDFRIKASFATLNFLRKKNAKITIIAHRGRPGGREDATLSLTPFRAIFQKWGAEVRENLRFDVGEEANDPIFAQKLAENQDVFINESFAESHREVASIVGLPKFLPHAAGFRFIQEVENLSKVLENPKRPLVYIISGIKKDKLEYLSLLEKVGDRVLVGGRLPEYIERREMLKRQMLNGNLIIADLLPDKEDITIHSIEKFEREIARAGTIVSAGPLGKYEEEGHRQGTERVFRAVINNKEAFKIAGGGDTVRALQVLSTSTSLSIEGFDWISVGGGAMLEYLAKGSLPGIEALLH